VLGYVDETWWTRLAQPNLSAWAEDVGGPLRLVQRRRDKDGPQALACYGLLRQDSGQMLLRFVQGRPVSQVTEDFLSWACAQFRREGKRVFVLVWDNAAWHISKRVRRWIGAHNRQAVREGGVKIVVCQLPVKAPWLSPIEPKWVHGKRAVVELDRKLAPEELRGRVYDYYGCPHEELLTQIAA
jgi:hypothetical protein